MYQLKKHEICCSCSVFNLVYVRKYWHIFTFSFIHLFCFYKTFQLWNWICSSKEKKSYFPKKNLCEVVTAEGNFLSYKRHV